jgi:hypothetical protein
MENLGAQVAPRCLLEMGQNPGPCGGYASPGHWEWELNVDLAQLVEALTHCSDVSIVLVGYELLLTIRSGAQIGDTIVGTQAVAITNKLRDERSLSS